VKVKVLGIDDRGKVKLSMKRVDQDHRRGNPLRGQTQEKKRSQRLIFAFLRKNRKRRPRPPFLIDVKRREQLAA
jgi:predicted RNA-binding protein with RPS1 domain